MPRCDVRLMQDALRCTAHVVRDIKNKLTLHFLEWPRKALHVIKLVVRGKDMLLVQQFFFFIAVKCVHKLLSRLRQHWGESSRHYLLGIKNIGVSL